MSKYMFSEEYIDLVKTVFLRSIERAHETSNEQPSHIEDLENWLTTVVEIISDVVVSMSDAVKEQFHADVSNT